MAEERPLPPSIRATPKGSAGPSDSLGRQEPQFGTQAPPVSASSASASASASAPTTGFAAKAPAIQAGERPRSSPLSVAVLVDLMLGPQAGGHVKCWQRFAEAAGDYADRLDLTVYFLGKEEKTVTVASNARYQLLPPAYGTDRMPLLRQGAGDTDLARYHKQLAQQLRGHHLFHATDIFTFARTARRVSQRLNKPLVSSIHTDLPKFTRVYSREIIERVAGHGGLGRLLARKLPPHFERSMHRRLRSYLAASDRVMISKDTDRELLQGLVPDAHISWLRRGIDKERFNPKHRDQVRLQREFGIPPDVPVLLFIGRVDESKKVLTMAAAARHLADIGHKLHALVIGEGADMERVRRLLGPNGSVPGSYSQDMLSWIYASCDLFVFPSESEVSPNVVLEARASGLPVLVSARDGGAQFITRPGQDGILVPNDDPMEWAKALAPLIDNSIKRAEIAYTTRKVIEQEWPSWGDVLLEDLLPVWLAARNDREQGAKGKKR